MENEKISFKSLILGVIAAVAVSLLLKTFVFQLVFVKGISMLPNIKEKSLGVVFKAPYTIFNKDYKRNEIVTTKVGDEIYIKRVIGLPGESIDIIDGNVFIDGEEFEDPYKNRTMAINSDDSELFEEKIDPDEYLDFYNDYFPYQEFELADDEYLLLGDNRIRSKDSRELGPFTKEDIQGKFYFIYKKK